MRALTAAAVALLALAGVAAWVVESEPDVYLRARYPLEYEHVIRGHAANHALDPALLAAVVYVESGFDPNAQSSAGAIGLMQLLPDTANGIALRTGGRRFVVADLRDPEINVRYGSWYLGHLRSRYDDTRLALAAYHAGRGNVDGWLRSGRGIDFPDTRAYVDEVLRLRGVYADAYSTELGLR
ncbi:MAG: lytic transglycosylase domain-containing protein [Gaiellaceae bacterium]